MISEREEALAIKAELRPIIRELVEELTNGLIKRKRMTVTVAPNGTTIGVAEPYGNTIQIPYASNLSLAIGNSVWVDYAYGMTNAIVTTKI
jgi:hypothetical protein